MPRAQIGHRKVAFEGRAPLPPKMGAKATKETGWFTWKTESLFGKKEGLGQIIIPNPSGHYLKHSSATDKACSSRTRLAEVMACRKAFLHNSNQRSTQCKGSNAGEHKASKTTGRSHEGRISNNMKDIRCPQYTFV